MSFVLAFLWSFVLALTIWIAPPAASGVRELLPVAKTCSFPALACTGGDAEPGGEMLNSPKRCANRGARSGTIAELCVELPSPKPNGLANRRWTGAAATWPAHADGRGERAAYIRPAMGASWYFSLWSDYVDHSQSG